ncbi:MAG: Omp28-related outer membrane protein [Ignavibacteria bacterium]|nr:Omp28-related outer membrane protein [Ignavibacteria bacterium]
MKKTILLSLFILSTILINNAGAFYIWQDFDNPNFPPAGWTLNTTNHFNWDWAIICSGYGTSYGSAKANMSDCNTGLTFDMITPQFTAAVSGDSLIFDHAYATYGGSNDQLKIWYSTDNGVTWTQLVLLNGGASGELVTAPATGLAFVPTPTQWATKSYSLPTGTNKIKFTAISAYGNNLYLDNIKIGTRYTTDAGASGFKRYLKVLSPGAIDTPKVYVRNFGTTTQNIPVTLTINPGGYSQTQTVTGLAAGSSYLATFPAWTVPSSGNITMKAFTTLSGDQNNSNDTIYNYYIASNNPRNVLIEYCTGTWCQWCPCAKGRILDLEAYYPNTIVLAYHGGSTSDPYQTFNGNNILSMMGMTAFPTGTIERTTTPSECGYSDFVERPFMRYLNSPVSPVKIDIVSQNYNASTRQLNVNLNTTALSTLTGQYKINYVITEDNLVYTQSGNSYCTGGSTYVHKWVVRNMVNTASGDNLNSGATWTNGQVINKSFSTTLDAGWLEANCKLKIFVYKDASPIYSAEIQQAIETGITLTGINGQPEVPVKFDLGQNYPNPFNPVTNIKFAIPKNGNASLKIYDITGKLVATYLEGYVTAGYYNAEINGAELSSGVYFYTLKAGNYIETKKMMLIK